jgi:hypothetical protein
MAFDHDTTLFPPAHPGLFVVVSLLRLILWFDVGLIPYFANKKPQ